MLHAVEDKIMEEAATRQFNRQVLTLSRRSDIVQDWARAQIAVRDRAVKIDARRQHPEIKSARAPVSHDLAVVDRQLRYRASKRDGGSFEEKNAQLRGGGADRRSGCLD